MDYKQKYHVTFPPFTFFCKFLRDIAKMRNDPSFLYEISSQQPTKTAAVSHRYDKAPASKRQSISVKKTETETLANVKTDRKTRHCAYHEKDSHTLNYCRTFRKLPLADRKDFLSKKNICFKCCSSNAHTADECKLPIHCGLCKVSSHVPAMHVDSPLEKPYKPSPTSIQTPNALK